MKNDFTVGLFIDWLTSPWHASLADGLREACAERGWNLVCFVTGRIGHERHRESERNVLLGAVSSSNLDAVVLATPALVSAGGLDAVGRLAARAYGRPVVSLGYALPGVVSVFYDNYRGFYNLLEHLYLEHGVERFAFLRGPQNNPEMRDRARAFFDFLSDRAIPAGFVLDTALNLEEGRPAARRVAEYMRTGNAVDAIVCSNDLLAYGVYSFLSSESYKIPDDMIVTGYDDIGPSRYAGLTTLRQDVRMLGRAACGVLERIVSGEDVPDVCFVPQLVTRFSCGCMDCEQEQGNDVYHLRELVEMGATDYSFEKGKRLEEELVASLGVAEMHGKLKRQLAELSVQTCYILHYVDSKTSELGLRPVFSYDKNGCGDCYGEFDSKVCRDLLPNFVTERLESPYALVAHALFKGDNRIGVVYFNFTVEDLRIHEGIRHGLSIGYDVARLLSRIRHQNTALRERKKMLEETNNMLEEEIRRRQAIQRELKRREKYFRDMAMFLPILIWELDADRRIRFVNKRAESIASRSDVDFLELIHIEDQDRMEAIFESLVNNESVIPSQFRLANGSFSTTILCQCVAYTLDDLRCGIRIVGLEMEPMVSSVLMPEEAFFEDYNFTPREKELLGYLVRGYSRKDIAEILGISENTVKVHLSSIYRQTGVKNKNELFKLISEYQVTRLDYNSYAFSALSCLVKDWQDKNGIKLS
ncbi:substrate-binding domain-containing protein [Spirochaetia bacterium 38H-sp]|uniref:Substrate-binding domain-containing protein n=2 Tax=Rarispira pelagica TaxID=3141764 RepID=A0ABU9UC58_9SPIR